MPAYISHVYAASHKKQDVGYLAGNIFADLGILLYLKEGKKNIMHENMSEFAEYLKKRRFDEGFVEGLKDHILLDKHAPVSYTHLTLPTKA